MKLSLILFVALFRNQCFAEWVDYGNKLQTGCEDVAGSTWGLGPVASFEDCKALCVGEYGDQCNTLNYFASADQCNLKQCADACDESTLNGCNGCEGASVCTKFWNDHGGSLKNGCDSVAGSTWGLGPVDSFEECKDLCDSDAYKDECNSLNYFASANQCNLKHCSGDMCDNSDLGGCAGCEGASLCEGTVPWSDHGTNLMTGCESIAGSTWGLGDVHSLAECKFLCVSDEYRSRCNSVNYFEGALQCNLKECTNSCDSSKLGGCDGCVGSSICGGAAEKRSISQSILDMKNVPYVAGGAAVLVSFGAIGLAVVLRRRRRKYSIVETVTA